MKEFDDANLVFDEDIEMLVLTEASLDRLGANPTARFRARGAASPEQLTKNVVRQVSIMIYQYLHSFTADNDLQDNIVKVLPSARRILRLALEQQFLYYMQVGNLSRSTDPVKRSMAIDNAAKDILDKMIPELGHSLTYGGGW